MPIHVNPKPSPFIQHFLARNLFRLLNKYKPETTAEKKERLVAEA